MTEHADKFDDDKVSLNLLPQSGLYAEARVLDFGAIKYDTNNWRKGMKWSRLLGAAMRHITAYNEGEDLDPESGISHLAHAKCCLSFLIEYADTHPELDDRYKA